MEGGQHPAGFCLSVPSAKPLQPASPEVTPGELLAAPCTRLTFDQVDKIERSSTKSTFPVSQCLRQIIGRQTYAFVYILIMTLGTQPQKLSCKPQPASHPSGRSQLTDCNDGLQ